jgi:hypothetical protein
MLMVDPLSGEPEARKQRPMKGLPRPTKLDKKKPTGLEEH